jgi:dCTP deaminase
MIEPFYERTLDRGLTFGLGPASYDLRIAEGAILRPGEFRLASSLEHFIFPANVHGELKDKSTWARLGLTVKNTVFDPGFCGFATLELTNDHHANNIVIPAGVAIAQMVFHFLDEPTEIPYSGKYQNQPKGPQGPK